MTEPPLIIHHPIELAKGLEIPAFVVYTWIAMGATMLLGLIVRSNLKTIPGGLQNVMELLIGGLRDFTAETIGKEGLTYFPLFVCLFFYITANNLLGLIPGMESSTSNIYTNFGMALLVFALTHIVGVMKHGFKYIKHFMGPVWWLAWLILPIELVGHCVRPVSLSIRLYGNIYGEDLVIQTLFDLVGWVVPLLMMGLAVFTSFLQAFVFILLSMLYIGGSLEEAH